MMLGCEHHGTHPSLDSKISYCTRIESYRIELISRRCIPVREDTGKRLDLFAVALPDRLAIPYSSEFRIQTEMYEH